MLKQNTKAFLLKKTLLANDDGLLEMFSLDYGRISIFIPRLARSRKKNTEIDFFRLLEIEFQQSKMKPKTIETKETFPSFLASYEHTQKGFSFLEHLYKVLPSEKPVPDFFHTLWASWHLVEKEDLDLVLLFLHVKILVSSGICPRFDQYQSDVYINPQTLVFSDQKGSNLLFVPHTHRQVLEFMRRSSVEDFFSKKEKLPQDNLKMGEDLIAEVWKYH